MKEKFEADARLGPHLVKTGLMRVDPQDGKRSRTVYEVAEKFSGWTLLRREPRTGRKHPIRVHLCHAGFPIVGDELYGGKLLWLSRLKLGYWLKRGREERPLISRVPLHAEQLTLPHPVTGETLTITAPWPKNLRAAVKYLRQYRRQDNGVVEYWGVGILICPRFPLLHHFITTFP